MHIDGLTVPYDLINAAAEIEDEADELRWLVFWCTADAGQDSPRYDVYMTAQVDHSDLLRELEADDKRKRIDPARLAPADRADLERRCLDAFMAWYNLEERGSAIIEGREPHLFEPMPYEAPAAQEALFKLAADVGGVRKPRASQARSVAAPAGQQGALL